MRRQTATLTAFWSLVGAWRAAFDLDDVVDVARALRDWERLTTVTWTVKP